MPINPGQLRDLHRIHRQITDLRERLERGPKQIKAAERNVVRLGEELARAKDAHTRSRVSSDEKQLQLKEREDRIGKVKMQLNTCSTNREYQALQEQIAADRQANSVLADEILEMLEKIDELEAMVKVAEANLDRAKQELAKCRKRVNEEQGSLETDLVRLTGELERAESALPADFKTDYERIVKARGEAALAQVEGETCGGCYQLLTPQTINDLQMSKPVFCKTCGRLLYVPEDPPLGP